jgi:outer membrane protein OmpA-like peptidoglycan-associated protein
MVVRLAIAGLTHSHVGSDDIYVNAEKTGVRFRRPEWSVPRLPFRGDIALTLRKNYRQGPARPEVDKQPASRLRRREQPWSSPALMAVTAPNRLRAKSCTRYHCEALFRIGDTSMITRARIAGLMGTIFVVGLLSAAPSYPAEQRSADDIINALRSPRATRGLTTSPADQARAADETKFLSAVRNRPTRSLSTEERDKIASIANTKPKIDLEINFEYNSAVIGSKAMPQVTELGKALTSEDLKGHTFILAGFTDAKGSETYNQSLSERRADAVKQLLSEKYGIEAGNLVTVGYGPKQLKDPTNPFAAENRRVQVVNAADK